MSYRYPVKIMVSQFYLEWFLLWASLASLVYEVNINWEPLTAPYYQPDGDSVFSVWLFDVMMAHKVKCISYLIQSFSPLSPVWHEHNSGFDNILPPAKFCFSHDKSASSEQWLDYARQVSCDRREEPLTAMSDAGGTEQGWEVNIFDDDPIPLLRQELKEFDALIGGCWYRGLVPYHEQMLHIFFRASNNTFAWYLVNHELHLANLFSRLSYRNPLHYDWVWAFVPRVESISHFKFVRVPIHL